MTILHPFRATAARLTVVMAILLVANACGGAASAPQFAGNPVGDGGNAGGASAAPARLAPAPAAGSGGQGGDAPPILEASRPDLFIIKTGSLDLQVTSVAEAVTAAAARVSALGGYVSGSEQSGDGDSVSASVTYRIPVDRWEDALAALRAIAIKVVREKTGSDDVTGQVVDLGARIANLEATERALQQIMTKATKIADVLSVQAELTTVRGQIEQAVAEKQHLTEKAAFSTLTVGFGLKPEAAVIVSQQKFDPKSEVDRASATMVDILQGLATAGIWFAIVWLPILLAIGVIALIVILVYRRGPWRSDRPSGGPPPPGPPMDAPASIAG